MRTPALLLAALLLAACGVDAKSPVASTSSNLCSELADYGAVECHDPATDARIAYQATDTCEGESLAKWEACGLSERDVLDCIDSIEACEVADADCDDLSLEQTSACLWPDCTALFECK